LTTLGEGREGVWRGASSSPVVAVDENGSSDEAPAFVRGWWPRSVLDGFELGPGTCIHVCGSWPRTGPVSFQCGPGSADAHSQAMVMVDDIW